MLLLHTAWKNLFRYKRRTFITAIAIAVGVLFSITFDGMLYGLGKESARNLIWHESAGAKFFAPGYFAEKNILPTSFLLDYEQKNSIKRFAEEHRGTTVFRYISPAQLYFTEEFFPASGSIDVVIAAVDPERDTDVFHSLNNVYKGERLKKGDGIVIGSWLAEDMKAEIGNMVTLEAKGLGGFYQTFDVPITGIVQTDDPKINSAYVFMDYGFANEMLELDGAVTEVAVSFEKAGDARRIAKLYPAFERAFNSSALAKDGVELYPWDIIYAEDLSIDESKSAISGLLMVIIFIIAAVGISNTMLMAVMERKNEVAMLKALGYSTVHVKLLFMYEGMFIGAIGAVAGFVLGCLANAFMVYYGMDFTFMLKGTEFGYRITGVIRSQWHASALIQIPFAALAVSAVSAYIPTGRMLKQEIADLFRKI